MCVKQKVKHFIWDCSSTCMCNESCTIWIQCHCLLNNSPHPFMQLCIHGGVWYWLACCVLMAREREIENSWTEATEASMMDHDASHWSLWLTVERQSFPLRHQWGGLYEHLTVGGKGAKLVCHLRFKKDVLMLGDIRNVLDMFFFHAYQS